MPLCFRSGRRSLGKPQSLSYQDEIKSSLSYLQRMATTHSAYCKSHRGYRLSKIQGIQSQVGISNIFSIQKYESFPFLNWHTRAPVLLPFRQFGGPLRCLDAILFPARHRKKEAANLNFFLYKTTRHAYAR